MSLQKNQSRKKIVIVSNTSWFIHNFLLSFMKQLQKNNFEIVALAPRDEWSDRFNSLNVSYIEIPIQRQGLNPVTEIRLLMRFYKIYKQEQPDFIFHTTIKPVIFGSFAARRASVKIVLNMIPGLGYVFTGNTFVNKLLRPVVKLLYKSALVNSYRVYFQNPEDRTYFVEHHLVSADKTEITYGLGVDLNHFQYTPMREKNGKCVFLLVARMLRDKGVCEFVEAAKAIKKIFPHAVFQLLGRIDSGNPNHIKKEIIDEWVKAGHIQYLGEVNDVRDIVANADVVVLPSYYREGIPNSLMEAMAIGRPIITTDMPGCRETIVNNTNGILIPPKNSKALIDAMRLLIEQPELRIEMGKRGREIAVDRFNVDRVNSMILSAMNDVR